MTKISVVSAVGFILLFLGIFLPGKWSEAMFGAAAFLIFVSGTMLAIKRKRIEESKQQRKMGIIEFIKKHFSMILPLIGLVLFTAKFLIPDSMEGVKTSVHLFALSTILFSLAFKRWESNRKS